MKDKNQRYQDKLNRVQLIQERLPMKQSVYYSLEDLQDAYLLCKSELFKERIEYLMNQLDKQKDKSSYHYLNRELEDLEEMLYLVEKKFSRTFKKALKLKNSSTE